jgi:hydroxyacylglutathione hydrolase
MNPRSGQRAASYFGGILVIIKTLEVGLLGTNCYLVICPETKQAIVIDPGGDAPEILAVAQQEGATIKYIINTHGHFDHTLANAALQKATGATIAIHLLDAPKLQGGPRSLADWLPVPFPKSQAGLMLNDGDVLSVGTLSFDVLHTPGHAPGHIVLVGHGAAFVGDVLFFQGIGRWDLEGGDYQQLIRSIQDRLLVLPDETLVYPGHGPSTTIAQERSYNPYIS